ncbi:hypothetical protein ATANTOWER_016449 [Ataeniobius toweri]|uniref:Uncharacterized protein n=1 Tax=Ataeniobius toweri TaxID=208326 RepID=A0ABU7AQF9_9TELE|nr:hypothetical protein [Ataeniobius toweri]
MNSPVLLGHPWLQEHYQHISWSESHIESWSSHCFSISLLSAIQSVPSYLVKTSPSPVFSSVPCKYHNIQWVFSKILSLSLSHHIGPMIVQSTSFQVLLFWQLRNLSHLEQ